MSKIVKERVVSKGYGILALLASVPVVLIVSAIFSFRSEVSCQVTGSQRTCTESYAWKGVDKIPLESIATALGTAFAIYTARRKWAEKVGELVTGESAKPEAQDVQDLE